ncbi:PAS domain S-box-containing protein [Salegentibacter holothuriorum]|uniref:histidine kinase n=1 Tax=Salegentibacter holothuriorum TaxID=241145 RepID=A0A1T5AFL4_9FLAO|nr:PAS domain-containing protein [Salegentibacter holothuriorum]SKB33764.1 PAS domain S-box-containing protein [Salegentibacter holothuriorum]
MINPNQLEEIFHSFPDSCLLLKPVLKEFIILEVNLSFEEKMGVTKSQLLGNDLFDFFNKQTLGQEFKTILRKSLEKALESGKPDHILELRYKLYDTKTGISQSKVWEVDSIPINNNGDSKLILQRFRDVTETIGIKEKEQASLKSLQRNEKLLKETQEVAQIGSWEFDLERDTVYWSSMVKEIHEVPQNFKPKLDAAIDFYKTTRDQNTIKNAVSKAIETGEGFDLELEITTARKKDKWIRATGKTEFKAGKCVRIYGATQDITSRKLAETRLESINSNIPGVVFRYKLKPNGEDELMYVSEGSIDIWGVSSREAFRDNDKVWELFHEADSELLKQSISDSATNLSVWSHEWRVKHPEKGIRWNRSVGSPHKFSDGSVIWDCIVMDVTQEKLAYEALQLNESRQRNLLESQTNYVIRTDTEGRYTYYNKKYEIDFHWVIKEDTLIGKSCLTTVIESDHEKLEKTVVKCKQNPNKVIQIELGKERRDGTVRRTLWDFVALTDSKGKPTEIQCIGIDVSEKYEAEFELNKTKEKYRGLIQSIQGIFWEMDARTFEFTFVSHQLTEMLGYKPEEWYSDASFWQDHIHPKDRDDAVQFCVGQTKKGENHSFEYRMLKKDGSYLWLRDVVSVIKENGEVRWLRGILTDISKRKHVEEQLQLSEQRFKGLVQDGGDLIALLDKNGDYEYVSPTSTSVLGYTSEEINNKNAFEFIHFADVERVKSDYEEVIKQKRVEVEPFRIRHKDNTWIWLETTLTNLLEDPSVKGIVSNARDVTEKKQFRELENLEREVLEMNFKKRYHLNKILNFYLTNLEKINPNSYFIIQKVEDNQLFNWASGGIPSKLNKALDARIINENTEICSLDKNGESLISKIEQAGNSNLKSLALNNKIDSCWSYPLKDLKGKTMAILAVFYKHDPLPYKSQEERKIGRSVGLLQLIIEFQLNEIALKRSNQRYKFVSKATDDAMYDWDVPTDHIAWGDGFYKMFKFQKQNERFPFDKWVASIHPEDIDRISRGLEKTLKDKNTNKWYAEYRFQTQEGNFLDIIENGYIIRDEAGNAIRMIGVLRDLTKLKVYEKELEEANERYRYVTRATSDAIWDYNLVNNSVVWGPGFEKLFGQTPKTLAPDLSVWYKNIHPDDREKVNSSFQNALDDGSEIWEEEYRYRNINGEYLNVFDRGFVVRDKKGKALRMVGAMQDITRKKQYENSLEKLNSDLKKRAKELAVSNAELEQFAYVASHDLQEPLRMVTSFLTQIEKKYGEVLDEKGLLYIEFAVDGAKRMRQIILDLLEFSRVGRTEDKLETVDINDVLDDVKHLYRKKISDKNVNIVTEDLPVIEAPKSPIRQVFQNLIGNSIKYSKEGVNPEIKIKFNETEDFWDFSIQDNGIGIDKAYFERIFVIFQRLHRREEYSGTGMGLAVTKKIIENLGGKISVESKEGEGSTFYFSIAKNIAKL